LSSISYGQAWCGVHSLAPETDPVRHIALSLLGTLALAGSLQAQGIRLNAMSGYTFKDRFPISTTLGNLDASIASAWVFGGGLEFMPSDDFGLEVYYVGMPTQGSVRLLNQSYTEDMLVSYIMLGGVRYANSGGMASPFGGLSLGAGIFDGESVSKTYFAWGLRGGVLLQVSDAVGIRIGAQLHSPVQAFGGGLYIGTGGVGGGVQTFSTIYQFGFTGGLAFTFGKKPDGSDGYIR
jgi:hypothetical protein